MLRVYFRKAKGNALPEHHHKANAAHSNLRSAIEHILAVRKRRFGLFMHIVGMVNLIYNFIGLA